MAIITEAQFNKLLKPGAAAIQGEYDRQPEQWKEIYEVRPSDMNEEYIIQTQTTGYAGVKEPGQPMIVDSGMREKYATRFKNVAYGMSTAMTRELIDDNQYAKAFPHILTNMKNSLSATKNTVCAQFIIDGATKIMPDGVALFSDSHPFDGGVYSNKLSASLNESSANTAMILASNFKDESGKPIQVELRKPIVSPKDVFAAERLTKSVFSPDTGNNAINAVYSIGLFSEHYSRNNFINPTNSPTAPWYILTNTPGMVLFQRKEAEFKVLLADESGTTQNLISSCYERYVPGCFDNRSIIASIV